MVQTKNNGLRFQDFLHVPEDEINRYEPVAGSFAIIQCYKRYLLCFNVWRNQWELPAGSREGDESHKECAIRELYEETGQRVNDLEFIGLLKSEVMSEGTFKYNPVYFSMVVRLDPFMGNEETSKIKLWDLEEEIGPIDELDIKVLDVFKSLRGKIE